MFLAVDVGTSVLKAAVLDPSSGSLLNVTRNPFPDPIAGLPPGHIEYDASIVTALVRSLLDELSRTTYQQISGLVVTGQMGGVVLVDETGQPLTRYISWRDQRVLQKQGGQPSFFEQLEARLPAETVIELGREVKPGYTPALLAWLQAEQQLPAGTWVPVGLTDAVVAGLCRSLPRLDRTQATGGLHLGTGAWHQQLLKAWQIDAQLWPELIEPTQQVGTMQLREREVPCYPSLGDHQAALLGAGLQAGELSLNISTGSQVNRLTADWQPGPYQTRPYFGGQRLNTLTHVPAGRALGVLINLLSELAVSQGLTLPDPWGTALKAAEQAPDTDLETELTFFTGPFGQEGAITHIREENFSVGTLFRSALRSMGRNYQKCAQILRPERDWSRLVLSGGLAQNSALLRKFIHENLPGEQRLCAKSEDTLWGLMALAWKISGTASTWDDVAARVRRVQESL